MRAVLGALACAALLAAQPAAAQIETVDPSATIDGDLASPQPTYQPTYSPPPAEDPPVVDPYPTPEERDRVLDLPPASATPAAPADASDAATQAATTSQGETYKKDDLIGAAEGVFGKGAEGLARMIEDILKKQGEPNAYIVGREGGGAFIFGARYGSGTLYHKVEGQQPVYWRGPSLGVDVGANAANTFVLVYNLFDTQDLFETYGAGEGQAYLIGGFHVSYLRKGDVVLIPVRMGAGLRLGINVGYMKFSKKQKWLPF
ncbi:hypothetical protein SZ64_16150 [Erythrobacter sp. SG61-1L]|uniref:DUF1134 domain-containing protein n=1 Tax=Erythrobacter sp. SG61-1L TaxID=1603897 RepID=UPI0006C9149B|nr:DUF1134 domain-containing protein [Erythrobacter sp. SG61-1L]KPL69499.1 hypothetical protein SZ64_16150 [Erythrobacter sp. SG61-1L]